MNEQYLTEIELPIWADPQGDVILEKSRDYCYLYFNCWEDKKFWEGNKPKLSDYIGKLIFVNAWAVKSLDVEVYDIYTKEERKFSSSICIVENSIWLEEMILRRAKIYKEWHNWDKRTYKHFHFSGHDNYFDIVAENYNVDKVLRTNVKKLWRRHT